MNYFCSGWDGQKSGESPPKSCVRYLLVVLLQRKETFITRLKKNLETKGVKHTKFALRREILLIPKYGFIII